MLRPLFDQILYLLFVHTRVPSIGISSAILLMGNGMVMSFKYFYDTKFADFIGAQNNLTNFSLMEEYGR